MNERQSAYEGGRQDEREQWLPLAGELRQRILHRHQSGGTVVLDLEDILAISARLSRAEGWTGERGHDVC